MQSTNGDHRNEAQGGVTPLLSVVIPTRNEERNIGKCIDALAGARDWIEVIVVDNASDDATREIASARGVRVFEQGPERSAQRNCGWREASAPFVCFLDADMRMLPETLAEIRATISSPDAPDALYIREKRVGEGWWIRVRNFERSFYDATCIDALRVFRRSLLERTGGYDETITGEEDWDLDRLCLAAGARVALTDGCLLHDEGAFSWRRHLRKKAYYSGTISRYRDKWNNDATIRRQLGIGYRFFGVFMEQGKWRRALAHPVMMASIFIERAIVGATYLLHRRRAGLGALVFAALALAGPVAAAEPFEIVLKPGDNIGEAVARLREGRKAGEPAAIVLEDGVYRVSKTVALGKDDSGVTIRARNRGKAMLVGGWVFKGSDMKSVSGSHLKGRMRKDIRKKCLMIDIPEGVYTNRLAGLSRLIHGGIQDRLPILTVDGAYQPLSHWPNGRERWWLEKEALCGTVEREVIIHEKARKVQNPYIRVERASGWDLNSSEAFIFGCLSGWGYEAGGVGIFSSTNGADVIEMHRLGNQPVNTYTRFVFFNLLEEIDEPGEWAFDTKTRKLVLYPDENFTKDSVCAVATFGGNFFSIKGAANVKIEGITFASKCGEHSIVIDGSRNCLVAGCRFSGVRKGVNVSGSGNKVLSCDFENLLDNCVTLSGGDGKTMAKGGNVVDNCQFREFGILSGGYADAVIVNGCGNVVRHCVMHGAIGHAMDIRGPENLVEYCRVYDVCRDHDDSGAVYANGVWSYGSILRYNDIGTSVGLSSGIYLDDFCCGTTVYGNILRNVGHFGVFLSGGRDIKVENNIFTGCWGGIRLDNRGLFWAAWNDREKFWKDVDKHFGITEGSAFAKAHPQITKWMEKDGTNMITGPVDNTYRNNLFLDVPGYSTSFLVCLGRDIPDGRTTVGGNMYVRTRGLKEGAPDFSSGDSSKIPDNKHTNPKSYRVRSLDMGIKVLDGTEEEPMDLGFVRLPEPEFDTSDYYWEQQGWVDEDKLKAKRQAGYEQKPYDVGDFTLKPDARLLKEMPGFKPIPFDKIGLYPDEYRAL